MRLFDQLITNFKEDMLMQPELLLSNLAVTIGVVALAMTYLRRVTRQVIQELCRTDSAAEFWLRSIDVMAYSGAVMLVLLFGEHGHGGWLENLRQTLVLTLGGLLFVVMFVANNVWRSVAGQVQPAGGK